MAYTPDATWRNRSEFVHGRAEIEAFLTRKWERELDHSLIKEIWAHSEDTIAVRFVYECHDAADNWYRSHGNENWRFDPQVLMAERHASINDVKILESDRLFRWPSGMRPNDHPGLTELGL